MDIDKILKEHQSIEERAKLLNKYYILHDQAHEFEKNGEIEIALKMYLSIIYDSEPIARTFYKRPAIILEKQKEYEKAIEVCDLVLNNLNKFEKVDREMAIEEFTKRKERLIKKLSKSNSENSSNIVKKNISSNTNLIDVKEKLSKEIIYPDWYISISFGESKSQSFAQAVALAQMAPQFIINNVEGKNLYQAVYSDKPNEYLQFITLYELVSQWKSCFVILNGKVMDRKIIGKLNYCYGDKCRSGKSNFCYGASEMTENPFGCHRLQISSYNNPWTSFGQYDTSGIFHIDKSAIRNRIMNYSTPYLDCPCFSMNRVLEALDNLPNKISKTDNYNSSYEAKMSLDELLDQHSRKTSRKSELEEKPKSLLNKFKSLFKK